ncbi:MAG TPA: nuclear transport factor 2 family protein [Amycolatopsis sp.]|nr:nuclear transport factor 2 family protein [Amycolatopsis sp.]
MVTTAEHPHAELVSRLLDAFARQDREKIVAAIAEDCVWRVPGNNVLAGEYAGRAAVLSLFGRLKRLFTGPAQFEIIDVAVSGERAISYQYGTVVVGGRTVRLKECLVFRVDGGQIVEVDEFQFDQHTFDEVFALDPLPTGAS